MKQNDWTSRLRERLAHREASVPDGLWDKIDARLDAADCKRRKAVPVRKAVWACAAAAAIAVLVVVGLSVNKDTIDNNAAMVARLGGGVAARRAAAPNCGGFMPQVYAARVASVVAKAVDGGTSVCGDGDGCATAAATDSMASESGLRPSAEAEQAQSQSVRQGTALVPDRQHKRTPRQPAYMAQADGMGTRRRAQWSVGAHAEGLTMGCDNVQRPLAAAYKASFMASADGLMRSPVTPQASQSYAAQMANYSEAKHHSHPVSVGLSVVCAITDRWALTTGVVYTQASSDFVRSVGRDDIVESQRLHYVGIPLGVKYKVWGNRSVQVYGATGGQADINVAATLTSGDISEKTDKDRVQFSVSAAAGVQYNIIPQVGVYAEPGVKYYFDNKSSVETVFKDKKCNFNLQLGLRFNF